ncbi:hypothetical protein [Amycolatopsis viridis]|uniref:Uncharacterized protein n=1 Tax=Amycolatopsis viridis TaxID=185678 RepID=A0ABX0SWU3_9PSEU|nr:hypothetical protein [Amycolatopsis viridis]NIH81417.1 hypothetical protein [Amycolatopsis viridis]
MGDRPWSQQVQDALSPGPAGRKVRWRALVGAFVLAWLSLWWSDWHWWPATWWFLAPLVVVVILPGIRRRVDKTWGLVAGFLLAALVLMPEVPGALIQLAWGLAIAATGVVSFRRPRSGSGAWVPIMALVVGGVLIAGGLVWWGNESDRKAAAAAEYRLYRLSLLYPKFPHRVVWQLIEGMRTPAKRYLVCFMFSPAAEQQFARAHGAADCEGALANLQPQITNFNGSAGNVEIPDHQTDYRLGRARLDACHLKLPTPGTDRYDNAGPQLGMFELEEQYDNGWMVTNYEPCR